ncbi:MAG: CRISPR-associated endonuclease Cas2 [Candidatus Zixiibacteriota bacterium]
MAPNQRNLSGYRAVWLMSMFDLPVDSPKARHDYSRFRVGLLKQGFSMLQFSVYARYCDSDERAEVFRQRIKQMLPPAGEVRLVTVTDRQFARMQVFLGKKRAPTEKPPEQLMLF